MRTSVNTCPNCGSLDISVTPKSHKKHCNFLCLNCTQRFNLAKKPNRPTTKSIAVTQL